jgi:L-lactate dehydrogenase (cytochrome)
MAGGERGVQRATDLLRQEIVRTMALLGVDSVSDLTRERALLRER